MTQAGSESGSKVTSSLLSSNSNQHTKTTPGNIFGKLVKSFMPETASVSKQHTQWVYETSPNDKAKWFEKVGYKYNDKGIPNGISLLQAEEMEDLPEEAFTLLKEVEIASVRLNAAFRAYPPERTQLYESLMEDVIITGFCGNNADLRLALIHFEAFKNMVSLEAQKIRKKFLTNTFKWSIGTLIVTLSFILFCWLPLHNVMTDDISKLITSCHADPKPGYCDEYPVNVVLWFSALYIPDSEALLPETIKGLIDNEKIKHLSNLVMGYALAIIGGAIGMVLIGFLRSREITYDSFDDIYRYGIAPCRYLTLITTLSLVLLMLVAFDVFVLGMGSIKLNDVVDKPEIGILIGLLCSISEPIVSQMVIDRLKPSDLNKIRELRMTIAT